MRCPRVKPDSPRGIETEAQLNWRPAIEGANSAYVIAAHTIGNARAFVLGIACGRDMGRDRPAEFRASGSYAYLADEAGQLLVVDLELL